MTVEFKATSTLPTRYGNFLIDVFIDAAGHEHMAILAGKPADDCLVRIHSECATGDIMGSLRCDCRDQLEAALLKISESGHGMVIYMRGHEGRGIGLANKIKAYALQDLGRDTIEANIEQGLPCDAREYSAAIGILEHYGIKSIRLLTNNPGKIAALETGGIQVSEHVSLWIATNPHNKAYIDTKQKRMGHIGSWFSRKP